MIIMISIGWKNVATRSLLGLMFLLFWLVGPMPALASQAPHDTILYEVTEDMYLKDSAGQFVASPVPGGRRIAVARLSGWAKLGTPLCPAWVQYIVPGIKQCTVNASAADDLSLTTGKGTLTGTYTVTVQDNNLSDAAEFVVLSGTFKGDADLSLAFTGTPLGFITNGVGTVDPATGTAFTFRATFRLPFAMDWTGKRGKVKRNRGAFYLGNDGQPFQVRYDEKSLGIATVRIDIMFDGQSAVDSSDDGDDTND
jgi:hypothetical protein